jgi:hypothetical protein
MARAITLCIVALECIFGAEVLGYPGNIVGRGNHRRAYLAAFPDVLR